MLLFYICRVLVYFYLFVIVRNYEETIKIDLKTRKYKKRSCVTNETMALGGR